ncbi:MAG: hypothetical protein FWC55_02040 [Firmicutes bacterium]|nr:hypothetical protein [Bacillota bacterium]
MLDGIRVPILILDPVWLAFFRNAGDERIKALQAAVKERLKEIAKVNETREALVKRKRECLARILGMSADAHDRNSQAAREQIDKDNAAVRRINGELEKLDERAEKLPELLEKANKKLLFETVSEYYVKMRERRARLEELNPRIDRLRGELRSLSDEKLAHEEEIGRTYTLLHGLVGSELIEKLDAAFDGDG